MAVEAGGEQPMVEREEILLQLGRVLGHPLFQHSKRYPVLLRHLVERALDGGKAEEFRERALGVAVFGREPDYDTKADPVVRLTASEVRKRLGQYYGRHAKRGEVVIDLEAGTYRPVFEKPVERAVGRKGPEWLTRRTLVKAAAVMAGVHLAVFVARPRLDRLERTRFWRPVTGEGGTVLLVAGQEEVAAAAALGRIGAYLESVKCAHQLKLEREMRAADYAAGPVVRVGLFGDDGPLQGEAGVRFRLRREEGGVAVVDAQRPELRDRVVRFGEEGEAVGANYAVVTRVWEKGGRKGVMQVEAAGRGGAARAAQWLADYAAMAKFARQAPYGWVERNAQVVLECETAGGQAGAMRVAELHVW